MAESSTRVADAASGNYIATRDANESDASANAREITLVDQSSRIWGGTYASPTRTVTVEDAADFGTLFASLDSGLTSNKLTVGDQNLLTVSVHIGNPNSVSVSSLEPVAIVPILLDGSNYVLGYLHPKKTAPWVSNSTDTPMKYTDGSSVVHFMCPMLSWALDGAGPYIGIGVFGKIGGYGKSGTDSLSVKIYADLVSGQHDTGFKDNEPANVGYFGFTAPP